MKFSANRVDFDEGQVRLETSKNSEGRVFPLNDDLRAFCKPSAS